MSVSARPRMVAAVIAALLLAGLLASVAPVASAHEPHATHPACENLAQKLGVDKRVVSAAEFVRLLDECEAKHPADGHGGGGGRGDVSAESHAGTLTHEARITRDGARLWANYSTGIGPSDLLERLPYWENYDQRIRSRVGWRYNYDSQYSVVLRYKTDTWGFMHRGSVSCCKNDGTPY